MYTKLFYASSLPTINQTLVKELCMCVCTIPIPTHTTPTHPHPSSPTFSSSWFSHPLLLLLGTFLFKHQGEYGQHLAQSWVISYIKMHNQYTVSPLVASIPLFTTPGLVQHEMGIIYVAAPCLSTLCLLDVTALDQISQAHNQILEVGMVAKV